MRKIFLCGYFISLLTTALVAMEPTHKLCNFLEKTSVDYDDAYLYLRINRLLEDGALPNRNNKEGKRPLFIAARRNMPRDIMALLINAGASVNLQGYHNETPLHAAVRNNHKEMVKFFIVEGAWRNIPDDDGNLPLHYAILHKAQEQIIKLVLAPFIVNAQNKAGDTPLHLAAKRGKSSAMKLLLEHGADPAITNNKGQTVVAIIKSMLDNNNVPQGEEHSYHIFADKFNPRVNKSLYDLCSYCVTIMTAIGVAVSGQKAS